ncbi:MAG: hypothetical protein LBK61_06320 [Spirochaetaceae bacterium]|nr:hypothetical protein [Spirochaetaceae bacterium]
MSSGKQFGPCGGRKPVGFSSLGGTYPRFALVLSPFWSKEQRYGRQSTPLRRSALPGAKTQRVFIPSWNLFPFWSKEQRYGRQSTPLWRLCFPFGRAMPPQGGALPAGNYAGLGVG